MKEEFKPLITPPRYVLITIRSILAIILVIAFACMFLPWHVYSTGKGKVTALDPNERVQEINAPISGFIEKWHVKEGTFLKKGELIVELVDADPSLMERIQRERKAAQSAVSSSQMAYDTALLNVRRQEKLLKEGLTPRKEFEKAKIDASKLEVELAKVMATLTKAETQVSRQKTQQVIAPRDGRVLRLKSGEGNQLVKGGDPLLIFAPIVTTPAVELWINGQDLPFMKQGQTARLQFEGWPSVQIPGWPSVSIGTFRARVQLVDFASSYQGYFRVLLVGDSIDWPSSDFVRLNSEARGIIHIRKTLLGLELWRRLNAFPPSQAPIEDELNRMLSSKKVGK